MNKSNRIFGIHPILEAIEAGRTIDKIMIQKNLNSEGFNKLRAKISEYKIPFQYVPIEKLNRLTGKNHQGVFAFLSAVDFHSIENILPQIYESGKTPFLIILDRVSDVRNFGAIIRTAECVGVDAIIIPEKGSAAVNEDSVKTSAGAIYNVPICKEPSLTKVIDYLQLSGIKIFASTEKASETVYNFDYQDPTTIVMGSEEDGVSDAILRKCDSMIKLPMQGKTQSLNVSVACGSVLYEVVRQRLVTP